MTQPPGPPSSGAGGPPLAPPPAPLLLVPGVCGTMLGVRPSGSAGDGRRCWVNLREADSAYKQLWGRYGGASGRLELLSEEMEACVPEGPDGSGLYAISVLDPEAATLLPQLRYWAPFIEHLQQDLDYTPGLTLFGCGYDFRQSCRRSAQELLKRLRQARGGWRWGASTAAGGGRVHVFSHSMGGLVVRSLLADRPGDFEALVGRWVAIGCPFGGAPGWAVDALLTGVQAVLQSPSVYELLPPLDFPWAAPPPQLTLWLRQPIPAAALETSAAPAGPATAKAAAAAGGAHCPHCGGLPVARTAAGAAAAARDGEDLPPLRCTSHACFLPVSAPAAASCVGDSEAVAPAWQPRSSSSSRALGAERYTFAYDHLPGLLARLLKDNAVSVGGRVVPLPFNPELWALGQATHAAWAGARLPPSCEFYVLHGDGVDTPYDVQYGGFWLPLLDVEALPHATAAFTYVSGDGTVPTECALAHGLHATATVALAVAHRDLVASPTAWGQVLSWLHAPAGAGRCGSGAAGFGGVQAGQEGAQEEECFWNPLAWQVLLAGAAS